MKGLLDFIKTPEGQGLLAAVAGGMAGARRGEPVNSLGRAGLAGLAGYSGAMDRQDQQSNAAFNQQFRQMQMDALKQQQEQQKAQQAWRAGLPGVISQATMPTYGAGEEGPTMAPPDPQKLQSYLMDPSSPFADKVLEQKLFPEKKKPLIVGDTVLDPESYTPLWSKPEKQDPNKPFLGFDKDGKPIPNLAYQQYDLNKTERGATRVDTRVDARNFTTQEDAQSKAYGTSLGEIRAQINNAGFQAPGKLAQLDRMEELLSGVGGGNAAPTVAQVSSLANSFGIKIDPRLGDKEAAEALAREMAANMREPGTGPMTDKDFDNFLKRVPDLSKTPEGRAQIFKTMRAALERDLAAAKFSREYARRNGGVIDDNYFDALADFYAQNPVVIPEMPSKNARGQAFSDPDKEKRYQEWLRKQEGGR